MRDSSGDGEFEKINRVMVSAATDPPIYIRAVIDDVIVICNIVGNDQFFFFFNVYI